MKLDVCHPFAQCARVTPTARYKLRRRFDHERRTRRVGWRVSLVIPVDVAETGVAPRRKRAVKTDKHFAGKRRWPTLFFVPIKAKRRVLQRKILLKLQ